MIPFFKKYILSNRKKQNKLLFPEGNRLVLEFSHLCSVFSFTKLGKIYEPISSEDFYSKNLNKIGLFYFYLEDTSIENLDSNFILDNNNKLKMINLFIDLAK